MSFTSTHFSSHLIWIPHLIFHKICGWYLWFEYFTSNKNKCSYIFLLRWDFYEHLPTAWKEKKKNAVHSVLSSGPFLLRGYCLSLISVLSIETKKKSWKMNEEHSGSTKLFFNIKFTDFFFPSKHHCPIYTYMNNEGSRQHKWQQRNIIKLVQRGWLKSWEQPTSLRRHGKIFLGRAVATQKVTDSAKTKPGSKDVPAGTPWVGGELDVTPIFFSCSSWLIHFVFSVCSKLDQLV